MADTAGSRPSGGLHRLLLLPEFICNSCGVAVHRVIYGHRHHLFLC
jgi:hypothetical protein